MDIDKQLGKVFSDAMLEILSVTAGFYHEVLSEESNNDFDEMVGLMHLKGKMLGLLFVSAKETDMKVLCSCMTGIPHDDLTRKDVEDALCELMNMTAGNAKLRLGNSEYVYDLTSPLLLCGENMSISTKKRTHVISRSIGNGKMSIKIKLVY